MLDKELKRMSRKELIEIIDAMKTREEELLAENAELKEELSHKSFPIKESSSADEATQELSRVLEHAQRAAAEYLEFIKNNELTVNATSEVADEREG